MAEIEGEIGNKALAAAVLPHKGTQVDVCREMGQVVADWGLLCAVVVVAVVLLRRECGLCLAGDCCCEEYCRHHRHCREGFCILHPVNWSESIAYTPARIDVTTKLCLGAHCAFGGQFRVKCPRYNLRQTVSRTKPMLNGFRISSKTMWVCKNILDCRVQRVPLPSSFETPFLF